MTDDDGLWYDEGGQLHAEGNAPEDGFLPPPEDEDHDEYIGDEPDLWYEYENDPEADVRPDETFAAFRRRMHDPREVHDRELDEVRERHDVLRR